MAKLAAKYVGVVKCSKWEGLALCVIGKAHGFQGRFYSNKGRKGPYLPIPINGAKTPSDAVAKARRFLVRTFTASRK